jgi:hypothetical protein
VGIHQTNPLDAFADKSFVCSYVFSTRIGTPPQNLHLACDTGVGDFWVWSWLLPTYMLENPICYNASDSSSSVQWQGQSFGVSYGSGCTYVLVWQDTLFIDNLRVAENPIEYVENLADIFVKTLTSVDGFRAWVMLTTSPRARPQQTWMSYVMSHLGDTYGPW